MSPPFSPQNTSFPVLGCTAYTLIKFLVPGEVGILCEVTSFSAFEYSTNQTYVLILDVSWEEPINPNGIITSYEVTVAEADNSSVIVYIDDSLTVTSVNQTVMIQPFTDYNVTVAASTSAGQGEGITITYEAGEQTLFYGHVCVHIICIYLLTAPFNNCCYIRTGIIQQPLILPFSSKVDLYHFRQYPIQCHIAHWVRFCSVYIQDHMCMCIHIVVH